MEALRLYPVSQPFIFFHESFHMSQLVTSPKADDYVYGAKDDYDLARTRDTDATVYNADSWSITGLAIWAQQEYNLPNPPIPQKYHPKNPDNGFQSLNDTSSPVLDVIYVDTQNVVPQGAWPVPQGSPYFVDTNLWEIYTPSSTVSTSTSTSSSSTAASSFTSTSTSAVATCSGNQVEGDCTAGIYPSVAPYSGDQAPVCDKADGGNTQPRLNSASASAAAATYCSELIASSTILTATDSPPKPGLIGNGAAENNGMLAVSVMFNVASCPQDQSNSTLDFAQLGQTECEMDLFGTVDQMCEQDSQWEGYNQDFTLEGGIYLADCGLWSLTGQAG
ncbi:MAG: Suppressor of the cold-sensitive snRNP biogenesis mutant brr1-1 [Bathelium mastoideum]|nr:MAG: Suppressor of the cold-sensitive snRNP biogenesis mutant brr1-1 [Bathelium mastoideum]